MGCDSPEICVPKDDPSPELWPVEGPKADPELAALAHPARVRIRRLLARKSGLSPSAPALQGAHRL